MLTVPTKCGRRELPPRVKLPPWLSGERRPDGSFWPFLARRAHMAWFAAEASQQEHRPKLSPVEARLHEPPGHVTAVAARSPATPCIESRCDTPLDPKVLSPGGPRRQAFASGRITLSASAVAPHGRREPNRANPLFRCLKSPVTTVRSSSSDAISPAPRLQKRSPPGPALGSRRS